MYHCFGCGVGGNVLTFVMDYENCTFVEAMEILAKRAGMELPQAEITPGMKAEHDKRQILLNIHRDAAIYYVYALRSPEGKIGYDYLKRRELSDETIKNFGLGYSSQNAKSLYNYLKQKGYADADIKDSGLVTFKENGAYDKFWNRVMYPIMDTNNRVIAFGGRVMGDGEPKYLNSPETKIFDKSRNLYGLNVARRTKEKFFLVCEGYMDVISMHQAGFTNAVASLGTAFTSQHGMIIKRYTDEAILCYDNDGAGRKAILRAVPILKEAGLRIKVLDLSPYKDPDEFMKNLGADEFRKRIQNAKNAFLFQIACMKEEYDFSDPEDKANFFNETAKKIAEFPDEIERNSYTEAVAKVYGIDYHTLKSKVSLIGNQVGIAKKDENEWKPKSTVSSAKPKDFGKKEAEKMVLTFLSEQPEMFGKLKTVLMPNDFSDELMQRVAGSLYRDFEKNVVNIGGIINEYISDERYQEVTAILSSDFMSDAAEEERAKAFNEAVFRIKSDSLDRQIDAATDPSGLMELLHQKQELKLIEII